ncbi:MAG: DUF1467 family protein [Pseudomonadota bacterium]
MSITSAIVFFAVIWALVFYLVNPLWQTSQQESGTIVPGTPPSAPVDPKLGKKALITTVVAAVVFAGLFYVIEWEVVTMDDLAPFSPPNTR